MAPGPDIQPDNQAEPSGAVSNPAGGGEWPDPATPPSGAAPGSDPADRAAIEAKRRHDAPGATATTDEDDTPAEREVRDTGAVG